jgi:hypothetical protein
MAWPSMRAAAAALMMLAAASESAAQEGAFDFALVGDMPYTKVQEIEYQRVLAALNAAEVAFVAHIGDFQFDATPYNRNPAIASMPCVDENYKAIHDSFQSIQHPFYPDAGRQRLVRLLAAGSQEGRSARVAFEDSHDVLSGRQKSRAESDRGA